MTATQSQSHFPHQSFWLWIMCLTGVDYFSTLGYQPSIAFEASGRLAPLATVILVLMTLFGALPVYSYVARQSPHGEGSIRMLERLVHGWGGKVLVLALLGFAATDFVITKTLSAADAAEHLIHNPYWNTMPAFIRSLSEDRQRMAITMMLLVMLGASFLRGFREVIGLAVVIVVCYLVLNAIVIGCGLAYLARNPDRLELWYEQVTHGDWHLHHVPLHGHDWGTIVLICLLFFPKLALGLSGFETGVAVMPLIRGRSDDDERTPEQRIRNTRKLLVTAALIMSIGLLGSSLVVSTLTDPHDLVAARPETDRKPLAKDRVLAHIAHGETARVRPEYVTILAGGPGAGFPASLPWVGLHLSLPRERTHPIVISPIFGEAFGTAYDISTIVILWFAGASAMAGLLNLVPQYLPRYGMAPEWARAIRPLVVMFTGVNLLVTWIFNADVTAQGGAYATGVLVLMSSACVATVIGHWRSRTGPWLFRLPWIYVSVTLVFFYTTGAIMIEKPDGIKIASGFIAAIILSSVVSRLVRSTELRFVGFRFQDENSRFLWDSMKFLEFPVLVPHRPGSRDLAAKEETIRREHRLTPDIPIVFIEAELGDASDFYQEPVMEVRQEEGRFILRVSRCASIAHVIAALGLELSKVGKPPEIHFGWSNESPLAANLSFVLFGEGNVPWMVRELIRKAEPSPERQPRIIIG